MDRLDMPLESMMSSTGRGSGRGRGAKGKRGGRGGSRGGGRGGRAGRGRGAASEKKHELVIRKDSGSISKKPRITLAKQRRAQQWQDPSEEIEEMDDEHEPVRKPRARKATAISTGTKLSVSNLDPGVTETDVNDLFSDVGELKSYRLKVNEYAESTGIAEVVYKRKADAMDAIERYHGVPLDGKPMQIVKVDNAEYGRGSVLNRLSTGPRKPGAGSSRPREVPDEDEWDQDSYGEGAGGDGIDKRSRRERSGHGGGRGRGGGGGGGGGRGGGNRAGGRGGGNRAGGRGGGRGRGRGREDRSPVKEDNLDDDLASYMSA